MSCEQQGFMVFTVGAGLLDPKAAPVGLGSLASPNHEQHRFLLFP